jgi:hypothetical protein
MKRLRISFRTIFYLVLVVLWATVLVLIALALTH